MLLALIVAFAALVRWPATTRELPHLPEPDAFLVMHAQKLAGDPALVRHQQFDERYPTLLTRLFEIVTPRVDDLPARVGTTEDEALSAASAPYRRGRILILLVSLAALPLVYGIARRFATDAAALIATALVATCLLHVLFSTQARPHAAHVTLALLATLAALRLAESASPARLIAAWLTAMLAVASLQTGFFVLPPIAIAAALAPGRWTARVLRAVLVPAAALALAFAFYPVLPRIDASGVHLGGAGGHEMLFQQFTWKGLGVAWRWFTGHDPLLAWSTLLVLPFGAWWLVRDVPGLWRGPRRELLVVLAYVMPYAALLVVNEEVYDRFLLPLVPWCAILAAVAWSRVGLRAARIAAACALLVPAALATQFARVAWSQDSLEQAADWFRAHARVTEDRAIATPYLALPLRYDPSVLAAVHGDAAAETNPWFAWQTAHPSAASGARIVPLPARLAGRRGDEVGIRAWAESVGPRWAVLESSLKLEGAAGARLLREWVKAHGELVFESDGVAPDAERLGLVDYQAVDDMARRLSSTRRFGPRIEIWRITR